MHFISFVQIQIASAHVDLMHSILFYFVSIIQIENVSAVPTCTLCILFLSYKLKTEGTTCMHFIL